MSDTSESTGSLDWAIVGPHGDVPDDDGTSTASSVEVVDDDEEEEEESLDCHGTPLAGSPNNNMPKFVLRLPSQSTCTQNVSDTDDEQSDISSSVPNPETSGVSVPESLPSTDASSTSSSEHSTAGQTYRQASTNARISREDIEDLCNKIDTLKKALEPNKNVEDITPDDLFGDGHPNRAGQSQEHVNNLPRHVENLCPSEGWDGDTSMQSSISSSYSFLSRDAATEVHTEAHTDPALMEDTANAGSEQLLVEQLLLDQEPAIQRDLLREPAVDEQKVEQKNLNVEQGHTQNNRQPIKSASIGHVQVLSLIIGICACLIGIMWTFSGPPRGSSCLGNMCYTAQQYKRIMDSFDDNDSGEIEMRDTIQRITKMFGHRQSMEYNWGEDTYQIKMQFMVLATKYRSAFTSQTGTEKIDDSVVQIKKELVSERVKHNSNIDEIKTKCQTDLDTVRGQCQTDLDKVKGQCQQKCNSDIEEIKVKYMTDLDRVRGQCQPDLMKSKSQCQHNLDNSRNQCQTDLDSVRVQCQTDLDKVKGQCQIDLDSLRNQCLTDLDTLKLQNQVQMNQIKRKSEDDVSIALKSCLRKPVDDSDTERSESGPQNKENDDSQNNYGDDEETEKEDDSTYNFNNMFPKDMPYSQWADTVLEMMNNTKYHLENTWAKVKNMSETMWQDTEPTISSLQETFREELVQLNKFQQKISNKLKKWFNRKQGGDAKTKRRKYQKDTNTEKKKTGLHPTVEERIVALSFRVDNFNAKTFRKTFKKKYADLESIQAEFKDIDATKRIPKTYEEKIKWKDYILTKQHLKWLRCQQKFWEDFMKAPDNCYAELCCWEVKIADGDVKACRKYKRRHGMVEDQCFLELPKDSVITEDDDSEIFVQPSTSNQQDTADTEDNWYLEMGEHRDYERNEPDDWFFRRKNKAQFDEQNSHKLEVDDDLNDDNDDDGVDDGVDVDDDTDELNCYPNRCHFEP